MRTSDNSIQEFENEGDRPTRTSRSSCSRKPLYIDFSRIYGEEDNWIIAPAGFNANYCDDECPTVMGAHLSPTNHAILQGLLHSVEPATVPAPCCVSSSVRPQSILYFDENDQVQKQDFPNMSIVTCGCR
ncbi:protein DVR-1-like [Oculina patagonica]